MNRRLLARAFHEIQAVPLPGTLTPQRKAALTAAGLAIGILLVVAGGPQLDWLLGVPAPAAPPEVPPVSLRPLAAAPVRAPAGIEARPIEHIAAAQIPPPVKAPVSLSAVELARRLTDADEKVNAHAATQAVVAAWGERPLATDETRLPDDIAAVAWRRGLQELSLTSNLSMLRLLDLPAVVALRVPGFTTPRYVAVIGMDDSRAVVSIDGVAATVESKLLDPFWSGRVHVLWRDFDAFGPVLTRGAQGVGVMRLQRLLRQVGTYDGEPTGVFDVTTETAVQGFQREHLLEPDGLVGPLTRIVLYAAAGGYKRPTLGTS